MPLSVSVRVLGLDSVAESEGVVLSGEVGGWGGKMVVVLTTPPTVVVIIVGPERLGGVVVTVLVVEVEVEVEVKVGLGVDEETEGDSVGLTTRECGDGCLISPSSPGVVLGATVPVPGTRSVKEEEACDELEIPKPAGGGEDCDLLTLDIETGSECVVVVTPGTGNGCLIPPGIGIGRVGDGECEATGVTEGTGDVVLLTADREEEIPELAGGVNRSRLLVPIGIDEDAGKEECGGLGIPTPAGRELDDTTEEGVDGGGVKAGGFTPGELLTILITGDGNFEVVVLVVVDEDTGREEAGLLVGGAPGAVGVGGFEDMVREGLLEPPGVGPGVGRVFRIAGGPEEETPVLGFDDERLPVGGGPSGVGCGVLITREGSPGGLVVGEIVGLELRLVEPPGRGGAPPTKGILEDDMGVILGLGIEGAPTTGE